MDRISLTTRNKLLSLGVFVVIIALGIGVYGYILQLPLHGDDLWHFAVLPATWRRVFISWRPIQTLVFKLSTLATGLPDARLLHGLGLVLHLLNGCLVYYILTHLTLPRRKWVALGAAVLTMVYPFSAEAVVWVAALNHLLNTALVLGAIALYLAYRKTKRGAGWYYGVSLLLALLAPFANESGVVIFLLLAMLLWAERTPLRNRSWLLLAPYVACAVFGFLVQNMVLPNDNRLGSWTFNLGEWVYKAPYLLQVFAYPIGLLTSWAYRQGILPRPFLFTALVATPALLVYLLLLYRWRVLRYGIFAIGWFIVTCAPAMVIQNPDYILNGPRLLYLSAFGAAFFWTLPLAHPVSVGRRAWLRIAAAATFISLVALSGAPYLVVARELGLETKKTVVQLSNTLEQVDGKILCINFPAHLGYVSPYLLGGYSARILPHRTDGDLSDLLYFNTGRRLAIRNFYVNELDDHISWKFARGRVIFVSSLVEIQPILREQQHVYLAKPLDTIELVEVGHLEATGTEPEASYTAHFAERLTLLSYSAMPVEQGWAITLRWQSWLSPLADTRVFLGIYDSGGELVASQSSLPLGGISDPSRWQAGDIWEDIQTLLPPLNLAPGAYSIKVGVSTGSDVARVPAYDMAQSRLENDAVTVATIEVN